MEIAGVNFHYPILDIQGVVVKKYKKIDRFKYNLYLNYLLQQVAIHIMKTYLILLGRGIFPGSFPSFVEFWTVSNVEVTSPDVVVGVVIVTEELVFVTVAVDVLFSDEV